MSNKPHHRVNLSDPTASFANLSKLGLASAASPILSFAPLLSPNFLFRELKAVRLSRLTHIGQPIQHVLLLPPSARPKQSPVNAPPAGGAPANKPSAAALKPTVTFVTFAPRPLSEAFVECLQVMAESVIKRSRLHVLLHDQPPEMTPTSFSTFYLSPYFVKFLPTFDARIRGDSAWFSWLDDIQALFSQETLPDLRFTPHLIAQIYMRKISPRAQRALHELALMQRQGKQVLLRQILAPKGLLLASDESHLPQRIRFGKQWVKDQQGKVVELRPDVLPFQWFVRWHIQRTHRHLEDILLDRALGGKWSDPLETDYKRLDDVMAQRMKMKKPLPDGFFIPSPEARLAAQTLIAALGRVATLRERELLRLLLAGASREEAAARLGMSRKTVDVHCSNLRQKWRAL
jgi:hypothetical protein